MKTKEQTIIELREYIDKGGSIRKEKLESSLEGRQLRRACRINFGRVYDAVRATGYDAKKLGVKELKRKWNKDNIKKAILIRLSEEKSINISIINKEHRGLSEAIRANFWTWDDALTYCGIDPDKHRIREEWTKDKLIDYVKEKFSTYDKSKDGSFGSCIEDKIHKSANSYFGGFKNLLAECGIDHKDAVTYNIWDEELIISKIKGRHDKGIPISAKQTITSDSALFSGALGVFGSWDNALNASGFEPFDIRHGTKRTKENLKKELLELYHSGESINGKHMTENHPTLFSALNSHFGNYENAVIYCGLDYESINQRSHEYSWSKDKVLFELKNRHKSGLSMNYTEILRDFPQLMHSCENRFSGLYDALDILKIPYKRIDGSICGIRTRASDGILYDSITESHCADVLVEMKSYGVIVDYSPHPKILDSKYKGDFKIVFEDYRDLIVEVDGLGDRRHSEEIYIKYSEDGSPKYSKKIKHYLDLSIPLLIISGHKDLRLFFAEFPESLEKCLVKPKNIAQN